MGRRAGMPASEGKKSPLFPTQLPPKPTTKEMFVQGAIAKQHDEDYCVASLYKEIQIK